MGIRFHCPNGHRLNVKTFLAGKRGYCPHCGIKVLIPMESEAMTQPADAEAQAITPIDTTGSEDDDAVPVWYVRPPSGGQFGPAATNVLNQWIAEQRVPPDSLVWREGWSDWRKATEVVGDAGFVGVDSPQIEVKPSPGKLRKSAKGRKKATAIMLLGLAALVMLATLLLIVR